MLADLCLQRFALFQRFAALLLYATQLPVELPQGKPSQLRSTSPPLSRSQLCALQRSPASTRMTLLELPMVLPLLGRYMQAIVSGAICFPDLSSAERGNIWAMDSKDAAHPYSSCQCYADLGENSTSLHLPTAFWKQALSSMAASVHALHDDLSSVLASGPLQPIHNCSMAAALASLDTAAFSSARAA